MDIRAVRFRQLPGLFAVCKLPADASIPESDGTFFALTRTQDEISLVCPENAVPIGAQVEKGWICFQLQGPFPFTMTGVLASFIWPLGEASIPIFAISTYDTDYVLIKKEHREKALSTLTTAGHETAFLMPFNH
jgi:hypothetical protein